MSGTRNPPPQAARPEDGRQVQPVSAANPREEAPETPPQGVKPLAQDAKGLENMLGYFELFPLPPLLNLNNTVAAQVDAYHS